MPQQPNYYTKDIATFVLAKNSQDLRKTPKKTTTLSSRYPLYHSDGTRCDKFTYGHYVDIEGRVQLQLEETAEPKLTLANDSVANQELAKHTLVRFFASAECTEGLQVIKANNPTSATKTRNLTAVIKKNLLRLCDVGGKFIEDDTSGPWDLPGFRKTALAYASVLGVGTSSKFSSTATLFFLPFVLTCFAYILM